MGGRWGTTVSHLCQGDDPEMTADLSFDALGWLVERMSLLNRAGHEVDAWRQLYKRRARAEVERCEVLLRHVTELEDLLAKQQKVLERVVVESVEQRVAMVAAMAAQGAAEGQLSGKSTSAFDNAVRICGVLTGDERLQFLSYWEYTEGHYNNVLRWSYASGRLPGELPTSPAADEGGSASEPAMGPGNGDR